MTAECPVCWERMDVGRYPAENVGVEFRCAKCGAESRLHVENEDDDDEDFTLVLKG